MIHPPKLGFSPEKIVIQTIKHGGVYGFDGFQASNMGFLEHGRRFLCRSEEGEPSDRPSDGESGGEESNDEPMDEETIETW